MTITEYNQTVDLISDGLFRFAMKMVKDESTADDVVQDSFERLWRHRDNVDPQKAKAYLFRVAYNLVIDRKRKEKRESFPEEMPEQGIEDGYTDLKEVLKVALNRLPEHYKSVVLLRDYEGYSYKEIGEIMEMTEAQVKINIYRARVALKEFIGAMDVVL